MDDKPNYYAIIPARIRYDPNLTNLSKLLYAEITALSNKEGFCWATNSYFAKIYGVTITTISISISKLAKLNYVKVENEYKGKQIIRRKITITELDIPIKENLKRGIKENINSPIQENLKDNNININIINNNNTRSKDQFNIFWTNIKTRKIGKKKAWAIYCKIRTHLTDNDLANKFNALIDNTKEIKYVPYPERWLKEERWNDEIQEFANGYMGNTEKIYRDSQGYIISKEEYEAKYQ
jgi:hypothetical protein